MISQDQVTALVKRWEGLKSDRSTLDQHVQEVLDYTTPRKATVTSSGTPGEKRMGKIYDSTGIRANGLLAAGLNSFLTSTVNKWFALRTRPPEYMKNYAVKVWLEEAESVLYDVFNSSNFGLEAYEAYEALGGVGTACVGIEEDPVSTARFTNYHFSEFHLDEGPDHRVNTLFRWIVKTARNAELEWGSENLSKDLRDSIKDAPDKEHDFLHVVMPRDAREAQYLDSRNMPWASVTMEVKSKWVVRESGFQEFPYVVPRWLKGVREPYGRSCGMVALPDLKTLNIMERTILSAGQKAVDPPLMMPHQGVIGSVRLKPGGITYVNWQVIKSNWRPEPLTRWQNIPLGLELSDQRRKAIEMAFFTDLFLLLMERPQMTATEVLQRNEEKMSLLSPVLGRLMDEFLSPMIIRIFGICGRAGMIPPPPPILQGQKLGIEYISPLARAQKLWEARAIRNTFEDIGPYANVKPEILDNFDLDKTARYIAELNGFPPSLLNSPDLVAQIRDGRAQAQAEMEQKQDAAALVDGMAKLRPMIQGGARGVPAIRQAA